MNAEAVLPRNRWDLPTLEHILVKDNICIYLTFWFLYIYVYPSVEAPLFSYKRLWNQTSLGLILGSLMYVIKLLFMSVVGHEAHHSAPRPPGTLKHDAYMKDVKQMLSTQKRIFLCPVPKGALKVLVFSLIYALSLAFCCIFNQQLNLHSRLALLWS